MSLPIRLLHLPIAAVLLTHCSLGSNPDGMPDSVQAAVERARQELGLLGDGHAAGVPVQLDAATLPFLSRQWKGRNAWRVDIVQPRWPALVLPNVVPRKVDLPYVQALSVLIDQSSGAVVRVNSVWPEREPPIAPYPPIAAEERQLADHEERFRPPSSPARISLARALAVIGANGGDLAHTRQILAYHVFHKTLQYSEREVWIVQLRGIPPFEAGRPGVPEDARNHLRHIVDAQTGEWLGADSLPQPGGR